MNTPYSDAIQDTVLTRLISIDDRQKHYGFILWDDQQWLKNWLGKDGDPSILLAEALVTARVAAVVRRMLK